MIAGDGKKLGLYGFGAAAHIVAQVAKWQARSVFAFTRPGDVATQAFAMGLGATWAGDSDKMPPESLDAAIIFAPLGDLVSAFSISEHSRRGNPENQVVQFLHARRFADHGVR